MKALKTFIIAAVVFIANCLLPTANLFSQSVGINNTGAAPADAALLEVGTGAPDTKGVLISRVALTDVSVYAPLTGIAVTSLIVYSTTSPTNGNGTGYYYWSGSKWIYIPAPSNGPGTSGQVLKSNGTGAAPTWQADNNSGIPSGIIVFVAGACPVGWTEYTALRGRFVVGTPLAGTDAGTVGTALADLSTKTITTTPAHTHSVDPANTAATSESAHTHGVGTYASGSESAHTHGVGTYAIGSESAHTHGIGTYTIGSESAHTHGIGSYANGSESAHTHGIGTYAAGSESAHTHAVDPPPTASGGHSVDHSHLIDPPNTGTDVQGAHTHTLLRGNSGGPNSAVDGNGTGSMATDPAGAHNHNLDIGSFTSGGTSANHTHTTDIGPFTSGFGSAHTHSFAGSSATGSAHTHSFSGSSAVGAAHTHSFSGSSAAGAAHTHSFAGSSAVGAAHTHSFTGTSAAGSAHLHNVDIASFTSGSTGAASVDVTMPYIQLRACISP